ncbi:MAG TPA: mobilome CxxCx(11)CxxC protein [Hanamia sp.]
MLEDYYLKLRNAVRENAFQSFGYEYIFTKRANKYRNYIGYLKGFGVAVPAIFGVFVITYGLNSKIANYLLTVAVIATVIQFVISLFAIFAHWDEKFTYSLEAIQSHNNLNKRFQKLADYPPLIYDELNVSFETLDNEFNSREQQDAKQGVQEWELRKGMRYALRQYKRPCEGCKKTPLSMKSTDCDVCGKFSFKYKIKNT